MRMRIFFPDRIHHALRWVWVVGSSRIVWASGAGTTRPSAVSHISMAEGSIGTTRRFRDTPMVPIDEPSRSPGRRDPDTRDRIRARNASLAST